MKVFLFCCLLLYSSISFGQTDSLQRQINEQVWKPFIKSFSSGDTKGFMAVHSKDMTRVIQDDNIIFSYEKYYEENQRGKAANTPPKWKTSIELRFIQRIAAGDRAFEVGYYKTTNSIIVDGKTRTGYGKFHVLLRKEKGTWKILMDADAHENTDDAIFLTGELME